MARSWSLLALLAASMITAPGCGDDDDNGGNKTTDICPGSVYCIDGATSAPTIVVREGTGKTILSVGGYEFKDSDGDGELDPYEDWRLSPAERAADLVSQMSTDQLAGLAYIASTYSGPTDTDGTLSDDDKAKVSDFGRFHNEFWLTGISATGYAKYFDALQEEAEAEEFGVPILFASNPGALYPQISRLGLGALHSDTIAQSIGDMDRRLYRAVGLGMQLGPQLDLASEPMWGRNNETLGGDAENIVSVATAYVQGLQGGENYVNPLNGVAAVVKHFPGAGANEGGMDSHNYVGRFNAYPGNNFEAHVDVFRQVIENTNPAGVMPCYSLIDTTYDGVDLSNASAFYNKTLITDILKEDIGFNGMITSDWGVHLGAENLSDPNDEEELYYSSNFAAYGDMWTATPSERVARWVEAGSTQLGSGAADIFTTAVDDGSITVEQLRAISAKNLEVIFKVGLFENPYPDPDSVETLLAEATSMAEGHMSESMVLLKNGKIGDDSLLPLSVDASSTTSYYYYNTYENLLATAAGEEDPNPLAAVTSYFDDIDNANISLADDPSNADVMIIRIPARTSGFFDGSVPLTWTDPIYAYDQATDGPSDQVSEWPTVVLGGFFTQPGAADNTETYQGLAAMVDGLLEAKGEDTKVVLCVEMARPFILPDGWDDEIDALLVDFGATDEAVLDVIFLRDLIAPHGYLPMELPSNQDAVYNAQEDVPHDTESPAYGIKEGACYPSGNYTCY